MYCDNTQSIDYIFVRIKMADKCLVLVVLLLLLQTTAAKRFVAPPSQADITKFAK
jgi:hypothetical protein